MDKITIIRRATEKDLEIVQKFGFELLDFERRNWDATLDPKWPFSEIGKQKYLEAIREKYTILVEVDGEPVGFLIGKILETPKDSARKVKQARLENIFVTEEFRQSGAGKMLFDDFKNYCLKNEVSRIDVSVFADNSTAVKFYQKVGFSPRNLNLSMKI